MCPVRKAGAIGTCVPHVAGTEPTLCGEVTEGFAKQVAFVLESLRVDREDGHLGQRSMWVTKERVPVRKPDVWDAGKTGKWWERWRVKLVSIWASCRAREVGFPVGR